MKFIIFSIIISVVSARNGQPIPGYVCPQEDIDRTGCRGPKDCLYPNPADCHSFIQCNDAGLAYEMPCAPIDLVYNDTIKECDWESNTPCRTSTPKPTQAPTDATTGRPTTDESTDPSTDGSTSESTSQQTVEPTSRQPSSSQTPVESTTDAQPSTTTTSRQPSTEEPTSETSVEPSSQAPTQRPTSGPFVCPIDDIQKTECKGPKDCLYPNPDNCNSFIQCTVNPDGTGSPVVMPCPSDLEWNDNIKQCVYPENSTCPKGSTPLPSTTSQQTDEPTSGQPSSQTPVQSTTEASTTTSTQLPTTGESSTTEEPSTTEQPSTTTTEAASSPTTKTTSEAPTTQTPIESTTGSGPTSTTLQTTTCIPVSDEDSDDGLDLDELCRNENCSSVRRTVSHPSNESKYIICDNKEGNTVNKCAPGLLWDSKGLSCNYAGLVSSNGHKSRY